MKQFFSLAALALALLFPTAAFSGTAKTEVTPGQNRAASVTRSSMRTMTDDDLQAVAAQGIAEDLLKNVSSNTKDGSKAVTDVVQSLNPLKDVLGADVSVKDIVYDPTTAKSTINADGSVTFTFPSYIGEMNFDNLRVKGSGDLTFGSITLRGIDLTGTTVTVKSH